MNASLLAIVDAFAELEVLVVGDPMLDGYLHGVAHQICREAPAPVVRVASRSFAPGGAANVVVNTQALGGRATLLGVIGDDPEGQHLAELLEQRGVSTEHLLRQEGRQTLTKRRVMAGAHLVVRFDEGSTEPIDERTEAALLERLAGLYPRADAVIISDYGYGVVTPRLVQTLARLQAATPHVLLVDAKDLAAYREVGVTAVKPSYVEVIRLLGLRDPAVGAARVDHVARHAAAVLERTGAQIAAVTLDADGALILERGRPSYRTYARRTASPHVTGAGDTYVSALALALAAGAHTLAAAELASAASAIVVAKTGTAVCSREELCDMLAATEKAVADVHRLAAWLERERQQGRRIVFTNGCFDLLHRGHITFLSRAKALGDVLVVGVNSDASARRVKGPGRLITPLEDRLQVLAALSCVDYLAVFDEDTPEHLLRALRPDVVAKGGNYTRDTVPEAPLVEALGGTLRILPYRQDQSTTAIIQRIGAAYAAPVADRAQPAEMGGR